MPDMERIGLKLGVAVGAVETAAAIATGWQALFLLGVSTVVYGSFRTLELRGDEDTATTGGH